MYQSKANGIYDKNITMSLSTVMNSRNIRMTLLYKFKLGNHATEVAENINLTFKEDSVNVKAARHWLVGLWNLRLVIFHWKMNQGETRKI